MKKLICITIVTFLIISCGNDDNKRIIHDNQKKSEIVKDSNSIEIAGLPIKLDSLDYLLHPIGEFKIPKSRSKILSSDYYSDSDYSFSVGNHTSNSISGNLSNIKFQQINSEELKPLTEKVIKITNLKFIYEIEHKLFIYTLFDIDTNKDKKLNYEDVEALYISNHDGSNFKKVSPELEHVLEWEIIVENNRIYFKTIEDKNKDGGLNRNDLVHYYYIDATDLSFKVTEYFPL